MHLITVATFSLLGMKGETFGAREHELITHIVCSSCYLLSLMRDSSGWSFQCREQENQLLTLEVLHTLYFIEERRAHVLLSLFNRICAYTGL